MIGRIDEVVFDCANPPALAAFWAQVLGGEAKGRDDSWWYVDPPGWTRIAFQRVPEGKVVKNRVHLDVRVGTGLVGEERLAALLAEEARLLPLGATRVLLQEADDENESCLTLQDVEGNEFCLD